MKDAKKALQLGESWGIPGGSGWIKTLTERTLLSHEPIPSFGSNPLLRPVFDDLAF
jgi:hypothetical protein